MKKKKTHMSSKTLTNALVTFLTREGFDFDKDKMKKASEELYIAYYTIMAGVRYRDDNDCGKMILLKESCFVDLRRYIKFPEKCNVTAENFDSLIPLIDEGDELAIKAAIAIFNCMILNRKEVEIPSRVSKFFTDCLEGKIKCKHNNKYNDLNNKSRDYFICFAFFWLTNGYMNKNWYPIGKNDESKSNNICAYEIISNAFQRFGSTLEIRAIEKVVIKYKVKSNKYHNGFYLFKQ